MLIRGKQFGLSLLPFHRIPALDDFSKLSLTPAFKVPHNRKLDFSVTAFEAADNALTLYNDLHCMTYSSRPTTLHMPNTRLAFTETEIRRSLKPLSVFALSAISIDQDLNEDNPNQLDHLRTMMSFQQH